MTTINSGNSMLLLCWLMPCLLFGLVESETPLQQFIATLSKRGGSLSTAATVPTSNPTKSVIRVAYQGEPGAYSEKATRELLGSKVVAVGRPSFEACFQAVASMECEYACLPIENSLGGSIHDNYDLMFRYDLTIIAEHEFRVRHCLLAKEGVKRKDIKYAISHPQALAQCDNFLRGLGIRPIPTYDTAGSAKMISEGNLPEGCTPENTAAIASDLAGTMYGLNCLDLGIEDDDTNFTRFLLLARNGVSQFLTRKHDSKTSVVFVLANDKGALFKALSCFALRDIDCSKIESRPTSASLLNYLKFRKSRGETSSPRFRYCFYLDFLASELDEDAQNALTHLREQADFVRVLGSYPRNSTLVGPVADSVNELKNTVVDPKEVSIQTLPSDLESISPLKIGIIGFGSFGQHLTERLKRKHIVSCLDRVDKSVEAMKMGVEFHAHFEMSKFLSDLDVVILAVPMVHFEDTVNELPIDRLRGKLLVDVCPLNVYPKQVMLKAFNDASDIDILCCNPMFGPGITGSSAARRDEGQSSSWYGRPLVYEKARITDVRRCYRFLKIFEESRCQMVEMSAEEHDSSTANAEFVTHLTGRLLARRLLPPVPVASKEYTALCDVIDVTAGDSVDEFFGMFKYNECAKDYLSQMRDNLARMERQLAEREAYLTARSEMMKSDRQRLIAETRQLLQEIVKNENLTNTATSSPSSTTTTSAIPKKSSSTTTINSDEPATVN